MLKFTNLEVAQGSHSGTTTNCIMEWAYLLCGCKKCTLLKSEGVDTTDFPPCSHAAVTMVIQQLNDYSTQEQRKRFTASLPRIMRLASSTTHDDAIDEALGIWLVKQFVKVEPLLSPEQKLSLLGKESLSAIAKALKPILPTLEAECADYADTLPALSTVLLHVTEDPDIFLATQELLTALRLAQTDDTPKLLESLLDTLEKTHAQLGTLADLEVEFCEFADEVATN